MIIKKFETGPLATNCYVVADDSTKKSIIIDAPFESADLVVRYAEQNSLQIESIVLTHGHWDHTGDLAKLKSETMAPVYYHHLDKELIQNPISFVFPPPFHIQGISADNYLHDNDILQIGSLSFKIFHAPGHTPGHIILYLENEQVLFTGDVLFKGSIGRTDFPGGNYDDLMLSIEKKILSLPDSTSVYPGHGPSSTVFSERMHNPFIQEYLEIHRK